MSSLITMHLPLAYVPGESGKQQDNADPLKITNAFVKVQYNLLLIISEISLPNSNSPHPKEEVLDSSMAPPFTCYQQYALLS